MFKKAACEILASHNSKDKGLGACPPSISHKQRDYLKEKNDSINGVIKKLYCQLADLSLLTPIPSMWI